MITGDTLSLVADGDVVIKRKLVSEENGVVYVCKEEEFDSAAKEKREPVCIGFKLEYVVG